MSATFSLDAARARLLDEHGASFDPASRRWTPAPAGSRVAPRQASLGLVDAVAWLQHESGHPLRVPVGVIGPRQASPAQLAAATEVGEELARAGLVVICGGRHGVMQAVCEGVTRRGGTSIGLLPDADPAHANPFVSVALATGIGEARNALIARAAYCLVAIGDSYGTLSEVALGRQFGKLVVGLEGAASVDGVVHVATAAEAVERVARHVLAMESKRT